MKEIKYDFNGLEYKTYLGVEQVFERIKSMMAHLDYGETYYHFVGHSDTRWNEMGMPDRARQEIVPLKQRKKIKTIGLYFPTKWLVEKFGNGRAVEERRDMRFLPEGLSFPIRFYCYGDVVHYIFEDGQNFNSVEVCGAEYAKWHRDLVNGSIPDRIQSNKKIAKIIITGFPNSFYPQIAVCSYLLLYLSKSHITLVEVDPSKAKDELSDLVNKSRGIKLMVR